MRKILFRGKCVDSGEWVQGDLINNYDVRKFIGEIVVDDHIGNTADEYDVAVGFLEVTPQTIGQYTELLDKNNMKIFEGDILKVNYEFEDECYYTVEFTEGYYDSGVYPFLGWCLAYNNSQHFRALTKWLIEEYAIEVVGNIFDNPELLENTRME